ncbi:hypothetical protein LXA43DRAFT_885991 [Ganoderma leucocontextum]|nr:hypothetical protein LXA43DRAFT_885991 [Ganoderma leucocontextum]
MSASSSSSSYTPPSYLISSCVYNVPMALDYALEHTRGLEPQHAKSRNLHMVERSRSFIIGPMPVQDFLSQFLPLDRLIDMDPLLAWHKNAFRDVPERAATVAEIQEPLLKALNKTSAKHKARCPGFVFLDATTRTLFPRKLGHMKPHICCYRKEHVDVVEEAQPSSRVDFGYAELFVEVTPDPSHDFFVDPPPTSDHASHEFLAHSDDASFNKHRDRAFGQQVAYATEIFARQHRVCVFSISMSGSHARFIRWDRAGCVVSRSFDTRTDPGILCEFLARFSQTDNAGRGHDVTVEPALPEQEQLFRKAIVEHVRFQLGCEEEALEKAVSEHYQPGHVTVMYVLRHSEIASEEAIHRFLVSRPVASPLNLTGRGTRGWWSVDVATSQVVFLKDTWRIGDYRYEVEGEALDSMNKCEVRNIPTMLCHGDVPDYIPSEARDFTHMQCSLSDDLCSAPWIPKVDNKKVSITKHWHYRIVLGTVGYGLRRFHGTEELLNATYDVFQGKSDAFTRNARLHRDISLANVILVRESESVRRKGYLIDWDSSCDVDESGEATETGRAGTWQFMSRRMLSFIGFTGKQTLQDDIESLLYVVLYCALLWLPHELSRAKLDEALEAIFDRSQWAPTRNGFVGGVGKLDNAMTRYFTGPANFTPPLQKWLDTVIDHHVPAPARDYLVPPRDTSTWSADQLEAFWADLLQTETLESKDKTTHDHPRSTKDTHEPRVGLDSTEAIVLGKRASEERGLETREREKTKRRKGKQVATESSEPRRSERLAEKEKRKQKQNPPQPQPIPKRSRQKATPQSVPRSPAKRRARHR